MEHNQLNNNKPYDVCIVGAGVAGATMAAYLGKHGKRVAIVERNLKERDVIIGELLQPGGVQYLQKMGLKFFLDDIDAQPVTGYDIILDGKDFVIPYPHQNGEPTGYGFRNGKFVRNMRKYILSLSNVTVIEGRVTELPEKNDDIQGVRFLAKGAEKEETIHAPLTIVSDGALSKFRDKLSKPDNKVTGFFLGILLKDCILPYPGHGHLVMGNHSPFVLYPVTSDFTRVLIDFPGEKPPKLDTGLKKYLTETFLPPMPQQVKPAFLNAVEEGNFKMFPNHRLPASPVLKMGAVLLGDSLNMRHPLTGGGMTAAFADVKNLGDNLLAIKDFQNRKQINTAVKKFYDTRHLGNQTINILADGLYGVVNNPGLRVAFFEYVNRGGKYADEPIAILAGINKDKKLLKKHFIGLASYGTKNKLKSAGIKEIGDTYGMVKAAVRIITPLLLSEKPDLATRVMLKTLIKGDTVISDINLRI